MKSHFWPIKKNGKKEPYPLTCVIFYLWLRLYFDKATKFIGEDMAFFKNKTTIVGAHGLPTMHF